MRNDGATCDGPPADVPRLRAIASDGTSLYAAVPAQPQSRSNALFKKGSIVCVDIASGRREVVYPAVDPCTLTVTAGALLWLDAGVNAYEGKAQRAPANGDVWWLDRTARVLRRWIAKDKSVAMLSLADSPRWPDDPRYGIATNATQVAFGYGANVVVVGKDGAGQIVVPRVDHNRVDDIGRRIAWVGLSPSKVYWLTADDDRTRLFSAAIASNAIPLEHTALEVTKGLPTLVEDDVYACGKLPGQPDESGMSAARDSIRREFSARQTRSTCWERIVSLHAASNRSQAAR